MIQRIQTVYLLLSFCLMAILVLMPFSSLWMIVIDAGAVAVLAAIVIFLYKKRDLQVKISYAMLLLLVLMYALYFIFDWHYLSFTELFRHVRFTFLFPFIAFILVYLAIRGIKKDEKLVRSLDRLR